VSREFKVTKDHKVNKARKVPKASKVLKAFLVRDWQMALRQETQPIGMERNGWLIATIYLIMVPTWV